MKRLARVAAAVCAAVLVAAPTVLGAGGASAAPREAVVYDALGDSYASGVGVPPYSACGRSEAAYPVQLDGRKKIALDDFVACSGATTASLVAGGQLAALDAETDLVTLMVGGNDIGWGQAVGACLLAGDPQCAGALASSTGLIANVLRQALRGVYAQVAMQAPNAHVVVVGYPRLFTPEEGDYLSASPAEQQAMNDGADLLNRVTAGVAAEYGFQFVDVTERFVGHGVNADEPWILGLGAGAFHPNAQGYQSYTAALTSAVNPSGLR